MKLGIIGAVAEEVELLDAALTGGGRTIERAGLNFKEGTLDGCPAVVVCCGVGKVNAALCAQVLVSEFSVGAIVNTGAAGGTDARLAVLDMVVATDAVQHDVDATCFGYARGQVPGTPSAFFEADASLRSLALEAWDAAGAREAAAEDAGKTHRMIEGRVASGDVFVHEPALRASILAAFSPACVEMEGAAIAQVARANGVPFAILRSVSDLAGEGAPMSYDEFSRKAAHVSSRVVREMASRLAKERL